MEKWRPRKVLLRVADDPELEPIEVLCAVCKDFFFCTGVISLVFVDEGFCSSTNFYFFAALVSAVIPVAVVAAIRSVDNTDCSVSLHRPSTEASLESTLRNWPSFKHKFSEASTALITLNKRVAFEDLEGLSAVQKKCRLIEEERELAWRKEEKATEKRATTIVLGWTRDEHDKQSCAESAEVVGGGAGKTTTGELFEPAPTAAVVQQRSRRRQRTR